ncbi:hypothetical protein [Nocardioides sp.]|uniref:hypothetical protein n=1 Tax=Nocardioides sp. TaxID=35761 RepID=UPI002623C88B|nr:hypothetical protein [Nocardioides sp.]
MTTSIHPRLSDDAGVRLGLGGLAIVGVTLVTSLAGVSAFAGLAVLGVLTAGLALFLPRAMALLIGVTAWAVGDGFVLNRFGELTFTTVACQWLVVLVVLAFALGGIADPDRRARR